ncbi:MAG: DUF4339 domain-containing protein [Chthoniobacterales bacterium]
MSDRGSSATEEIDLAPSAYIARDGEELGEFTRDEIVAGARSGDFRPNDYYWQEGMEKWIYLEEILGSESWQPLPEEPEPAPEPAQARVVKPEPEAEPKRELELRPTAEPQSQELAAAESPSQEKPLTLARDLLSQLLKAAVTPELKNRLIVAGAIAGSVLLVVLIAIFFITRREAAPPIRAKPALRANSLDGPVDPSKEQELRDNAAADLRAKIERLPANAEPPLNTFYYDVAGDMRRSVAPRVWFEAVVRGSENVVDPQTQQTVRRTEFTLTAQFRDGSWFLKQYHGEAHSFAEQSDSVEEADEKTPAPPLVVTLLGLKLDRAEADGRSPSAR